MKNKNDGYGQSGMVEKQRKFQVSSFQFQGKETLPAVGERIKIRIKRFGCAAAAFAVLGLASMGCSSVPHTTIAGKLNGSPFLIEAPKDGDLTGFDLTADSNGVVRVHIDHLAVKMNPDVIGQSGAAQAGIIQATGVVASNITAAAVAAALRGN
jgi:hypothetical protein